MGTLFMPERMVTAGSAALPQPVAIPLTRAAIFLVVAIRPGAGSRGKIRSFCADFAALVRSVGFRELEGSLSCVLGFGSHIWHELFGQPRPVPSHKFPDILPGDGQAVATPEDVILLI